MWVNTCPLTCSQLSSFEKAFRFTFHHDLQAFLKAHNAGSTTSGIFPTAVRERELVQLFDFSDQQDKKGAWGINKAHRKALTEKRIIIGTDNLGNYVCVEREHKQQKIVVWNHVTDQFEPCLWDISMFSRYIG